MALVWIVALNDRKLPIAREERRYIVIPPPRIARRSPAVETGAAAANVHHGVDRARTSVGFTTGHGNASFVETRLGIGHEAPVVRRTHERYPPAGCEHVGVLLPRHTGFEHENANRGIERKTMNQRAA